VPTTADDESLWEVYREHGRPHIGANGVSWPAWKMDEKLKSENMQKRAVFYVCVIFWEQSGPAGVENGAMLTIYLYIQIYFRMHHFVVRFSKFSSPQAARGHWPPSQNPTDVPGREVVRSQYCIETIARIELRLRIDIWSTDAPFLETLFLHDSVQHSHLIL